MAHGHSNKLHPGGKIFPTAQDKYYELSIARKTWTKWKDHSVDAPAAIECATRARGGSFESANAAAEFHGTGTAAPTDVPDEKMIIPSSTVDKIDGYLDNLAVAATNERDVLEYLVSNNKLLAITNATTLSNKKALLANAANSGGGSTSRTAPVADRGSATLEVATLKRQVQQLRSAIRYKWSKGVFCSTHVWGFNEGHDSNSCLNRGTVHVTTATRTNPAGPVATNNKGWDDFWT